MDIGSESGVKLLQAIATSYEMLIDAVRVLRSDVRIVSIIHKLECRNYETGVMLEEYIDVELPNSISVCLWLDVTYNEEHWIIQASILSNDDQGQMVLEKFNDRTPSTMENFGAQLREATTDSINAFYKYVSLEADSKISK